MQTPRERPSLGRRRLLGLVGGSALAGLLPGCAAGPTSDRPSASASCVPRRSLDSHSSLAGRPFVYEVSQRRASFSFEPAFFAALERWLASYVDTTGLAPDQVWSYGGWTDGGSTCDSWHNAGRAVDLARLRLPGGEFVSCRYDRWRTTTGAAGRLALRRYWALAATLHLHFAYVLTYLYNAQHHNHIHVDNGRSGAGLSTLTTRSRVQVQAVQAICTHLWDEPVETSGTWDAATRRATRRVLERHRIARDLDDSTESWRSFLTLSAARGSA